MRCRRGYKEENPILSRYSLQQVDLGPTSSLAVAGLSLPIALLCFPFSHPVELELCILMN